jgi:hypothetical protein
MCDRQCKWSIPGAGSTRNDGYWNGTVLWYKVRMISVVYCRRIAVGVRVNIGYSKSESAIGP